MDQQQTSLKRKMEEALEEGNLEQTLSHLHSLLSSTPDKAHLLTDHTVNDLPTLHHLARFPFEEDDGPRLSKLIKIFTDFGYDVNKSSPTYNGATMEGAGATALMASIDHQNLILMECLLRHGARTDILDHAGLTLCHWAVMGGNVKCLEVLVEFGGTSVITSIGKSMEEDVHPLLHTAVDKGSTEILEYLLTTPEFGLDVNEKAIYSNYKTSPPDAFRFRLLAWAKMWFTPLQRAVRHRNTPILQVLLRHPGVKMEGFKELQFCIEEGDTEVAKVLLEGLSSEQVASHKIGNKWALHCIHPSAFQDMSRVEFTKNLILEYVRRGWDVNSVSTFLVNRRVNLSEFWNEIKGQVTLPLSKFTLLHQACLHQGQLDIIKALVEDAGADINGKTDGKVELTPLQILLPLKQWKSAEYLISKGADMSMLGSKYLPFTRIMRRSSESLNAVELLIRMGCEEGLPVLEQVLAKTDVVWHGANEFHLAVEGANPLYISKVLQYCEKFISKEDIRYVASYKTPGGTYEKVPTLLCLINALRYRHVNMPALADLIKLLVKLGCELNLTGHRGERILDHILEIDFRNSSHLLLHTLLQSGTYPLNWSEIQGNGLNPVESVLRTWSNRCNSPNCWENRSLPPPLLEAVKLLIAHGLDVTGMVIDAHFTYHLGYKVILKMLYIAGAKISENFFTGADVCPRSGRETKALLTQEIAEVKRWKVEFDQTNRLSVQHMCRLEIRKMVKCVGDLRKLDVLPASLRDYVLCKTPV